MASLMTLRRCQNFRSLEKYIGPLSPLSLSHFLSSPSLNCCSLNKNLFLGNFLFPFDLFFLRPEIPRNSTNRSSLMSAAARFASNAAPAKKHFFGQFFSCEPLSLSSSLSHSLSLILSHSLSLILSHSLSCTIYSSLVKELSPFCTFSLSLTFEPAPALLLPSSPYSASNRAATNTTQVEARERVST